MQAMHKLYVGMLYRAYVDYTKDPKVKSIYLLNVRMNVETIPGRPECGLARYFPSTLIYAYIQWDLIMLLIKPSTIW